MYRYRYIYIYTGTYIYIYGKLRVQPYLDNVNIHCGNSFPEDLDAQGSGQLQMKPREDSCPQEQLQMKPLEDSCPQEQLHTKPHEDSGPQEQLQKRHREDSCEQEQLQKKPREDSGPQEQLQKKSCADSGPQEQLQKKPCEDSPQEQLQKKPCEDPGQKDACRAIASAAQTAQGDITRANVKKRLARLFRPRVDGSHLVPEELVQQYKDLDKREALIDDFIKSGLQKDGVELLERIMFR